MPFVEGYIKKGKLNYKKDYMNNVIGTPDGQQRVAYFFINDKKKCVILDDFHLLNEHTFKCKNTTCTCKGNSSSGVGRQVGTQDFLKIEKFSKNLIEPLSFNLITQSKVSFPP